MICCFIIFERNIHIFVFDDIVFDNTCLRMFTG